MTIKTNVTMERSRTMDLKVAKENAVKAKAEERKEEHSPLEKDMKPLNLMVSPKESTLERQLKMERQTLQALSQLLKPILMPPMVRLGMNLHMEIRIHTAKTGVTHIMTVQLVTHGTQRMASVGIWPPMKEERS